MPDAHEAAREYEAALREGFARAGRRDQTFDVMLLGLGEDAHIASIFPEQPAVGSDPARGLTPLASRRCGRHTSTRGASR